MAQQDIIEVLTQDHREVEEIFDSLEGASGPEERADRVEEVTIELVRHSVAEEQWLYPTVREAVDGGDEIADKEIADHAEVEQLLKDLEGMSASSPGYAPKVKALIADVREHLADEENNLFPKLRSACAASQLRDLGEKVEAAKRSAPTRPHPSSPSTPPANKVLDPGAGMIDRLRDALTGRG